MAVITQQDFVLALPSFGRIVTKHRKSKWHYYDFRLAIRYPKDGTMSANERLKVKLGLREELDFVAIVYLTLGPMSISIFYKIREDGTFQRGVLKYASTIDPDEWDSHMRLWIAREFPGVKERHDTFKEELVSKAWRPERVAKWLEAGATLESL